MEHMTLYRIVYTCLYTCLMSHVCRVSYTPVRFTRGYNSTVYRVLVMPHAALFHREGVHPVCRESSSRKKEGCVLSNRWENLSFVHCNPLFRPSPIAPLWCRSKKDVLHDVRGRSALVGATVVKQPGDGSCLFHSLAYGARQLPVLGVADVELSTAEGVRARVLRFLESHPAEECAGVPLRDWVLWESNLEPVAYCSRMRQPGAWGGAIEMLCFSRVANASVRVYERKGDGFEQISAFDVEQQTGSAERLVRVLYSGRSHYDALTVSV